MIRIGILGDIGSGKSFIAKLFKQPVFDADKEVKKIYNRDRDCYVKLKKKLPDFVKSFPIKKNYLINSINKDKKNLYKISSIVHPIVRKKMKIFLRKNKNKKMVVLDIPLLIENNLNKKNDILIFVKTSQKKIIKRLKRRPNFNPKVLKNLKEKQIMLVKKRKISDFIIDNNYGPNIMKKKVNFLKKKILND